MKVIKYGEFREKWVKGKKNLDLTLIPEDEDDLWHLYNLVREGDVVWARTSRVIKERGEFSRQKSGRRVPLNLSITVKKVSWDRVLNRLRVHGIVKEAPEEYEVTGFHHTLTISINKPIRVTKERWMKRDIDRLERSRRARGQPIVIVSIDDEDLCVAAIREFGVDVKVEEKIRLPGKMELDKRVRAKIEFFKRALETLKKALSEADGKVVIIGPGFMKDEFFSFLKESAPEIAKEVVDVKGVNSAGLSGIYEALRSGVLSKALSGIRLSLEMKEVREVLKRLGKGSGDIVYGLRDVERAAAVGAVERLLVVDSALREAPDEIRLRIERVMNSVEDKGGKVMILSSRNEAGTQIKSLGGAAAILRFSLG